MFSCIVIGHVDCWRVAIVYRLSCEVESWWQRKRFMQLQSHDRPANPKDILRINHIVCETSVHSCFKYVNKMYLNTVVLDVVCTSHVPRVTTTKNKNAVGTEISFDPGMRLLTHNSLRNNAADAKGKGYPLKISAAEIRVTEHDEFDQRRAAFIKDLLPSLEWSALVEVCLKRLNQFPRSIRCFLLILTFDHCPGGKELANINVTPDTNRGSC